MPSYSLNGNHVVHFVSRLCSSTRNRTWNFSLEARGDVRFTIEPCYLRQLIEPTERKARESNPHLYSRTALAVQPSKPYLATFQVFEWSHRDSNSGSRHAMAMSSRWTMTPFHTEVRSRIELDLRSYQERALPEHLQTLPSVIAEGIEPSISCVSCRCLSRWTTRSLNKVVETGVEPAESLGSRPSRFSGLRTQPIWKMAGPGVAPGSPSL